MTSKGKHHKHPPLVRSSIGTYHRCEWAVYGSNCSKIRTFYDSLIDFKNEYSILYVDADHSDESKDSHIHIGKKQFSTPDVKEWSHFDDRLNALSSDAAIINGNHYAASRQIVFIDPAKKDSLKRREEQLTNIDIVIVNQSEDEIYDFVKERMSEKTKVFNTSQMSLVLNDILSSISNSKPPLKAIILAGGKSQRMGIDKSQIIYHGEKNQEQHLLDLLKSKNIDTYISKRYNNQLDVEVKHILNDKLVDMGPFGAIISAMMHDPNIAWLVIACDLPFLNEELIDTLIINRNSSKYATAFRGAENPFPEPLITIYEPRAYQRFLSFLSLGYACPRKVLINSEIEEIVLENVETIINANTPEEMEAAKSKIANG